VQIDPVLWFIHSYHAQQYKEDANPRALTEESHVCTLNVRQPRAQHGHPEVTIVAEHGSCG
jgi:hypothetical protein